MILKEQLARIKGLIAKAKLKEAVDLLLHYAVEESTMHENAIISLSSKYYELEEMSRNTIIVLTDYQRLRNQVIINMLEWVETFEQELEEVVLDISLASIKEMYALSIARTKILTVLLEATDGLNIKDIHEASNLKQRKFMIAALNELMAVGIIERYRIDGVSLNRLTEEGRKIAKKWF